MPVSPAVFCSLLYGLEYCIVRGGFKPIFYHSMTLLSSQLLRFSDILFITVKACSHFQAYDKIQSLIIFATAIEAESSLHQEIGHETDLLECFCNSLCQLVVFSTDVLGDSSAYKLVGKAKQLLKRALVDSNYVFARVLWQNFMYVASVVLANVDGNNDGGRLMLHKPAMMYAQSIYDMVPPAKQVLEDKILFEAESKKILGDENIQDINDWLNVASAKHSSVSSSHFQSRLKNLQLSRYGSSEGGQINDSVHSYVSSTKSGPYNESNRKESNSDDGHNNVSSRTKNNSYTDSNEAAVNLLITNQIRLQTSPDQQVFTDNNHTQEKSDFLTNPIINDGPNILKRSASNHTQSVHPLTTNQVSENSQSKSSLSTFDSWHNPGSSENIAPLEKSLQLNPEPAPGSKHLLSLDERIEAKQKGISSSSPRRTDNIPSRPNEEVANIERRIAAKTSDHYEPASQPPISAFAKARSFRSESESSRSSIFPIYPLDKTVYKTEELSANDLLKGNSENSFSSSGHTESNKEEKAVNEFKRTKLFKEQKLEGQTVEGQISVFTRISSERSSIIDESSIMNRSSSVNMTIEQQTSPPLKYLPRMTSNNNSMRGRLSPSHPQINVATEALIDVVDEENNFNITRNLSQHNTYSNQGSSINNDIERRRLLDGRNVPQSQSDEYETYEPDSSEANALIDANGQSFQTPGEDSGFVIATAVESDAIDNADDAVLYDPKAKRRSVNRKMQAWTTCAIIAATAVAVTLGLVFTKQNLPTVTPIPTPPPTTTDFKTLKDIIEDEFGFSKPYGDLGTAYGRAFFWLTKSDTYILNATERLNEDLFSSSQSQAEIISDNFYHEVKMRYLLSLFYYKMNGDGWSNCTASFSKNTSSTCSFYDRDLNFVVDEKKRWLSDDHICTWAGIMCDSTNKSVLSFELSKYAYFRISCNARDKYVLMLFINVRNNITDRLNLYGTIPTEISKLAELNFLTLFENTIRGSIPSEIAKLDKLKMLDLSSNFITGEIGDLYNLTNLVYLDVGNNDLNGTIAETIGHFASLTHLLLYQNRFSGPIPSTVGNLGSSLSK